MGGQLFAQPRSQQFLFLPSELVIIRDPSHPLYSDTVELPPDRTMVELFEAEPCADAVIVAKLSGYDLPVVVDGRKRTLATATANAIRAEGALGEPFRLKGDPIRQERGESDDAFLLRLQKVMVAANEVRRANDPVTRGLQMRSLRDRNVSIEHIARLCGGITGASVHQYLAVVDRSPATVLKAIKEGRMTFSDALALVTGKDENGNDNKTKSKAEVVEAARAVIAQTTPGDPVAGKKPRRAGASTSTPSRAGSGLGKRGIKWLTTEYRASDHEAPKLNPQVVAIMEFLAGEIGEKDACETVTGLKEALKALKGHLKDREAEARKRSERKAERKAERESRKERAPTA